MEWDRCGSPERPFEAFDAAAVPVAVELRRNAESLITFTHPDNAVYVFGPEDGSLDRAVLELCHRFVVIPTRHCTNLAAAVYTVLYDRHAKRVIAGTEQARAVLELCHRFVVIPTRALHQPGRAVYTVLCPHLVR
jgi:hypothetical protein